MLQFSQYFNLKYLDFILILFNLISLILFIYILFKAIKNRNIDNLEVENIDTFNSNLSAKNIIKVKKKLQTRIINIVIYNFFIYLFVLVLLIQTINLLFPSLLNSVFLPDSQQKITITNSNKNTQNVILLGRLSYSNYWIPILSSNNNLQFIPEKKLVSSEKITYNVRTGIKDVDHIIVANITNGKFVTGIDALAFFVPSNDLYIYTGTMEKLNVKPNVYLIGIINIIFMYFTGFVGTIALFFTLLFKIDNKKLIKIIFLSLLFLVLAVILLYAALLNLYTLLLFL